MWKTALAVFHAFIFILKGGAGVKSIVRLRGNSFRSVTEMCEFYSVSVSLYHGRRYRGWSVEDAVLQSNSEELSTRSGVYDHKAISLSLLWRRVRLMGCNIRHLQLV